MDVEVQHVRTYHAVFSDEEIDRLEKMVQVYDDTGPKDVNDAGKIFEDGIELLRLFVSRARAIPMTVNVSPDGMTAASSSPFQGAGAAIGRGIASAMRPRSEVQGDNSGLVGPWVERND